MPRLALLFALSLLLALPGLAPGQEEPAREEPAAADAAPVFSAVLARARASGAIERVLGEHPFLMTRHGYDEDGALTYEGRFLMRYRLALDEARGLLRLEVDVRGEGAEGAVTILYHVGLDGRLRGMRSEFPSGEVVLARLEGERLRVTRRPLGGEVRNGSYPVGPATRLLPKIVAAFVLPALHDQGLPERVAFQDLDPFGQLTRPLVLRRDGPGDDGAARFATEEGRAGPTTTLRLAPDGAPRLVHFVTVSAVHDRGGAAERPALDAVCERLDPAGFARLEQEWGLAPAAGTPTDPAPDGR